MKTMYQVKKKKENDCNDVMIVNDVMLSIRHSEMNLNLEIDVNQK